MTTTVAQLQGIVEVNTDQAVANLRTLNSSMDESKSALGTLGDALGAVGLGVSLAGLAAGAIEAGKEIVNLGMDMEQTRIGMTTLLGSTDATTRMLENLRQFAMKTPFQFLDLVDASKRMIALGFSAQEVIPTLTAVGDTASALGMGSAGIDRLTYALGQMKATGHITGMEIREMAMAGVPVWKYLAEAIGSTTDKAMELESKGLIPANEAIKAITSGMERDFGGMMQHQMDTAAGAASNLKDKLQKIGTEIGTDLLPVIHTFIGDLATAADAFDTLYNWNRNITAALDEHNQRVAVASLRYEDYINEMLRAEAAAGRLSQSDAEHVQTLVSQQQAYAANSTEIQNLIQQYGNLTPAQQTQAVLDGKLTEDQLNMMRSYQSNGQAIDSATTSLGLYSKSAWEANRTNQNAVPATEVLAQNWQALGEQYMKAKAATEQLASATMTVDDRLKILKEDMAGAVGKENADFADSQGKLEQKALDLQEQYDKLAKTQGMHYGPSPEQLQAASDALENQATLTDKLAKAQFDLGPATEKLAKAQEALAKNTDPKKAEALQGAYLAAKIGLDNAKGSIDSINDSIGKNNDAIHAASGGVIDHTKQLKDLQGQLQAVDGELEANAAAYDKKTKQVIFDMLEEAITRRNTLDGQKAMTDEQVTGLETLAAKWGLVDQATATANADIIQAVGDAAKTGNWSLLWGNQDTTTGKMYDILNSTETAGTRGVTAIDVLSKASGWEQTQKQAGGVRDRLAEVALEAALIPKDVTMNVHFNIDESAFAEVKSIASYSGNPSLTINNPNMTHISTPATPTVGPKAPAPAVQPSKKRAGGGPVVPDSGGYWVGEEGPEWFEPTVAGTIVPNGAGGGGGDTTIYAHFDYTGQQLDEQAIVAALNRLSYVYG